MTSDRGDGPNRGFLSPAHIDVTADAWYDQSERDRRAAEHLLRGGFAAHATVTAHLAVEKALKGWMCARDAATPPVTHDLRLLADRLELHRVDGWTSDLQDALDGLSDVSILSLYAPDRPFGHPVATSMDVARERVAAALSLLDWIRQHRPPH